ncbi:hypothetical protein ACHAW5_003504 [Stephanodiscus triporus]|uniref:Prohibitin n=1 Tax=Stephanodiscus triporus TaxID=2934178 RepID=A0ABD3NXE9_9STRA
MNSGSGIAELMAAENRASQIVAEARIARGDRLKQAQADADALIAAYRLEQQDAFDASPVGDGKFFGLLPPLLELMKFRSMILFYPVLPKRLTRNLCTTVSSGSGDSSSTKLQAETAAEILSMQAQFSKNAQKAVDVLLSKCCEVSLDVPAARIRSTQKLYGQ